MSAVAGIRQLKASQFRAMAWKNGGGQTIEIAVSPQGAGLDDFDWRISMARVERDGPFSAFNGVDRTLAVLSGDGLQLSIGRGPAVEITDGSPPLAFDGGAVTHGELRGGPVLDLNLMTRRNRFRHRMTRINLDRPLAFTVTASQTLLLAPEGGVEVEAATVRHRLEPLDVLHGDGALGGWRLVPATSCRVFVLEVFAIVPRTV